MSFIIPWTEPIDWAEPSDQETMLLVIRHGETYGNDASNENEYTMTGCRTNFPLNENGQNQAARIAKKIASLQKKGRLKISAIYSSYLTRAVETANFFFQRTWVAR